MLFSLQDVCGVPYLARLLSTIAVLELAYRAGRPRGVTGTIKVLAIIHSSITGSLGLYAMLTELWQESRDVILFRDAPSFVSPVGADWANALTSFSVGFFLWELSHYNEWPKSADNANMVVHHVVSSILWPLSIRLKIAYFFLTYFETSELSSPFLQLRWFVKVCDGPELLSSGAFVIAFFVVRTSLIIPMFYAIYRSRPWDGALYPELSLAVRITSIVSLCIPFLLNTVWSWQIWLMIKKTIKRNKEKKG